MSRSAQANNALIYETMADRFVEIAAEQDDLSDRDGIVETVQPAVKRFLRNRLGDPYAVTVISAIALVDVEASVVEVAEMERESEEPYND